VTTPVPHRLKLDVFEGPLDLLLHLVKINEMEIADIQIAEIARQYMSYLTMMEDLDLDVAGDYLVMAATLMNIKSRSLLPRDPAVEETSDEEEIDEILSTQDLIRRLVAYRRIKELAEELRQKEEENSRLFYRATVIPLVPGAESEMPRQDILNLFDAFARVLSRVRIDTEHHVQAEAYSVEDKVVEVREKLRTNKQLNFSRIFETCVSKAEVVCYFLAILELARMREITLAQADAFEDILVEPWDDKVIYVG